MNDFRTSMAALEIDTPQLSATQLVVRPGTLPTLTIPVFDGLTPDVGGIWDYLSEPAEFFGVPMPRRAELAAAVADSALPHLNAVTITIAEADGAPQILVARTPVRPLAALAVRIAGGEATEPAPRPTDPWWRRMAARTTSRGEADQLERWLNTRGYADAVIRGVPRLGALVFQTDGDVVGVENPEPTSILGHLERCGAIATIDRGEAGPADAARAWWISPRFQTHPVVEVDGKRFPVDTAVAPPFARWS